MAKSPDSLPILTRQATRKSLAERQRYLAWQRWVSQNPRRTDFQSVRLSMDGLEIRPTRDFAGGKLRLFKSPRCAILEGAGFGNGREALMIRSRKKRNGMGR